MGRDAGGDDDGLEAGCLKGWLAAGVASRGGDSPAAPAASRGGDSPAASRTSVAGCG